MNDVEQLNEVLRQGETIIEGVRKIRTEFAEKAKPVSLRIVDAQLYLYLGSFDLTTYHKCYLSAALKFEKKLFCRLIALYLYEFIEDIHEILGGQFRKAIKSKIPDFKFEEFNQLINRINLFDRMYGKAFQTVRNEVIAHRGHDPLKQIELIDTIDITSFLGHLAIIYKLSVDINFYLSTLLEMVDGVE